MIAVEGRSREIDWEAEMEKLEEVRDNLIAISNKDRKLKSEVYDLYGCKMELSEDGETIETIYYPTYRINDKEEYIHVGYRNRKRFKKNDPEVEKDPSKLNVLKNFKGGIGDTKKGITMFGQWLFKDSEKKRLIICCGEEVGRG